MASDSGFLEVVNDGQFSLISVAGQRPRGGPLMPKRVLDGEGLWRSDKIATVEPIAARAEYANILPLALANGTFECSARRVWSSVYSFNRPDVSLKDVEIFLEAFERAKLLFRWIEPDGKQWGYFVGIEKAGRLPGPSRKGKNEKVGATPPEEGLRKFLESKNFPGFGSGFGSGSCTGSESGASHPPERCAPGVCADAIALWNEVCGPLPKVLQLTKSRQTKIQARVKENPSFLELLRKAALQAVRTPFLCGAGDRGWKASFDWFISNDTNALRVAEGAFENGNGASNGTRRGNGKPNGAITAVPGKYADLKPAIVAN